jgi:hypothetical protein
MQGEEAGMSPPISSDHGFQTPHPQSAGTKVTAAATASVCLPLAGNASFDSYGEDCDVSSADPVPTALLRQKVWWDWRMAAGQFRQNDRRALAAARPSEHRGRRPRPVRVNHLPSHAHIIPVLYTQSWGGADTYVMQISLVVGRTAATSTLGIRDARTLRR